MSESFLVSYGLALGLTLLAELGVAWVATPKPLRRHVISALLLLNLFTHPVAYFLVVDGHASWLAVEVAVVAVECLGLRLVTDCTWRRSFATSLACNAVSAGLGLVIFFAGFEDEGGRYVGHSRYDGLYERGR